MENTRELLENFRYFLETSKSPHTARMYYRAVREFLRSVGKPIDQLTALDISAWQRRMLQRLSPRSVDSMSAAIKTFFRAIGRYDLAMQVPNVRYEVRHVSWLPEEKVVKIIEAGENELHQAVLATGYELALRVGEVVLLERDWFNYKAGQCKVRRLKRKGAVPAEDFLPMRPYFADKLKAYLDSRDDDLKAMFVSYGKFGVGDPRPISINGVQYIYRRAARRAGVDPRKVSWHAFARHSRITNYTIQLIRETRRADLVRIMKLAGHVSEKSTMVYVHLATEYLLSRGEQISGELGA